MISKLDSPTSRLHQVRGLILDMDGVLWKDHESIGDLPLLFKQIADLGLRFILATNNSTRDVKEYCLKLSSFGVLVENWQVVNSALATASYLRKRFPAGGPVYVIGSTSLKRTLSEAGYTHCNGGDVLAVVAGMDRILTYKKLTRATLLIRNGTPFIGTNPDRTFPTPQGLVPGTGAILAAIQAATDAQPIICGKPEPEMYWLAMERLQLQPFQVLVIGDRLETDIAGAQTIGCNTALVLSGVTSPEQAMNWSPPVDLIAKDLAQVIDIIAITK